MNKEDQNYIKGMEDMLEWICSLPMTGGAKRELDIHLFQIEDLMEKIKMEEFKKSLK